MQDPVKDIKKVLSDLVAAESPDVQQAAVYTHYASNAGFRDPFVWIDNEPNSRDKVLAIWQWCRILSPSASIRVGYVAFHENPDFLLVDTAQQFCPFFSPFKSGTLQVLTKLTLVKDQNEGLYTIALHEDFYEPWGVAAMIYEPLAPLVRLALRKFASISTLLAKRFQAFNYWRPKKTGIEYDEEIRDS